MKEFLDRIEGAIHGLSCNRKDNVVNNNEDDDDDDDDEEENDNDEEYYGLDSDRDSGNEVIYRFII